MRYMRYMRYMRFLLLMMVLLIGVSSAYAQVNQSTASTKPVLILGQYDKAKNEGYLVTIDATNMAELSRISLGNQVPGTLVLDPFDPIVYVSSDPAKGTGLTIVDLSGKFQKGRVLEGTKISSIDFGPDGFLYAATGNQLIQLYTKLTSVTVQRTYDFPDNIRSFQLTPQRNGVYAALDRDKAVGLNFKNGEVEIIGNVRTTDGNQGSQLVGKQLIVAGQNVVSVLNISDLHVEKTLPATNNTYAIQSSKDLRTLYIADNSDGSLLAVDIYTGNIERSLKLAQGSRSLSLSPNGKVLFATNLSNNLSLIETDSNSALAQFQLSASSIPSNIIFTGDFSGTSPKLKLIAPAQAVDKIEKGKPFKIEWQTGKGSFDLAKYSIELSTDGGNTFTTLVDNLAKSSSSYIWNVPNEKVDQTQLRVTAYDLGGYKAQQLSDLFKIDELTLSDTQKPTVKFLYPVGNEKFNSGDSINVTWTSSDNVGVTSQELALSMDGGATFTLIVASGLPGSTQSFSYQSPPTLQTSNARLRLTVSDAANNSAQTVSQNFNIGDAGDKENPTVSFTSPIGGEQFSSGSTMKINWASSDNVGVSTQDLALSTDSGATFPITIVAGLPGSAQSFNYQIPNSLESNNARLRLVVRDRTGNSSQAITPSSFQIAKPTAPDKESPKVVFINPTGGEKFTTGDILGVSWNSSDNVGVTSQDLALSTDGGLTFPITIASGLGSVAQSFSYQIPSSLVTPTAKLRLNVRDGAGNVAQAVTLASFEIREKTSGSSDTQAPIVTISKPLGDCLPAGLDVIEVTWQSSDNIGVVSQELLVSVDDGLTFQLIATFNSDIAAYKLIIPGLDQTIPRAAVKITARDNAGNTGLKVANFSIAPVITDASLKKKVLTISGVGFTSSSSQSMKSVIINGKELSNSLFMANGNNTILVVGSKKKLGLKKGENIIKVTIDNTNSNTFSFNLK